MNKVIRKVVDTCRFPRMGSPWEKLTKPVTRRVPVGESKLSFQLRPSYNRSMWWILLATTLMIPGGDWELCRDAFISDRPEVVEGCIDLTIGPAPEFFPRFFNELGVKRIRLRFQAPGGLRRKLSIVWTGGSMGPDKFGVRVDGIPVGVSRTLETEQRPCSWYREEFVFRLGPGADHVVEILSLTDYSSEINFSGFRMSSPDDPVYQPICYDSVGSLKRYEKALGDKGVVVESDHLVVFAPKRDAARARALASFLEEAYDEMVNIYGLHPIFKFCVEHFPPGHERGWGGISGAGTIGYTTEALDRFARMKRRDVRGFAGYTEEMCHGFKDYYRCGGTYEALGVAVQEELLRRLVPARVADAFWGWRHKLCAKTTRAYLEAGRTNPDPEKYPWNVLFTRILNHLFEDLRQEYGPELWTDFFRVIRQMDYPLHRAGKQERMKIYVEIFSTLFGRNMQEEFEEYGIDIDADPPWGWETYGNE